MLYFLKPHYHAKICLCHSNETFLELPRQLLLQNLRLTNPKDTLFFVYDSQLFSKDHSQKEAILEQLNSFCFKNNIRPYDIRHNLCLTKLSQEEATLFSLYEDEINHLEEGGCLETATRYLRLFDEILALGIVSAENVYINTNDLPESLPVVAPILFDIVTQDIPLASEQQQLVTISTDLIAITDKAMASATLLKLRKKLIDANTNENLFYLYREHNIYSVSLRQIEQAFSIQFGRPISPSSLKNFPSLDALHHLSIMAQDKTPRALRNALLNNPIDLVEMSKNILGPLYYEGLSQDALINQAASILRLSILENEVCRKKMKQLLSIDDSHHFLTEYHLMIVNAFLACAAQYASGDLHTTLTLHPLLFCPSGDDGQKMYPIKVFGFSYYALHHHFKPNGYISREDTSILPTWRQRTIQNSNLQRSEQLLNYRAERMLLDIKNIKRLDQLEVLLDTLVDPLPTRTGYALNPHAHVKIWLSNNPDSFMNIENKLRLVKMRAINPNDTITLVFDSQLLTPASISSLMDFCKQYNIISLDVREHFAGELTFNEQRLLAIYEDEISNLNRGGNLGAASDILRWFKCVYTRGIYTDLDIDINTQSLPQTLFVDACILINMDIIFKENQNTADADNELIFKNMSNDIIAVVHEADAEEKIKSMQLTIIHAYENPPYQQSILNLSQEMQNMLKIIRRIGRGRSVRELRHDIGVISGDNKVFTQAVLGLNNPKASDISVFLQKFGQSIQDKSMSTEGLLTKARQIFQTQCFMVMVSLISGPIRQGLFPEAHYSNAFHFAQLKGYAFQTYARLKEAFHVHHDLSWTPGGIKAGQEREVILRSIAKSHDLVIDPAPNITPSIGELLLDEAHQASLIIAELRDMISNEMVEKNKKKSELSLFPFNFFNKSERCLPVLYEILEDINTHQYVPEKWAKMREKIIPSNINQEKIVRYIEQLARIHTFSLENARNMVSMK